MILNYPNNPTGLSYTKEELKSIAKICKKNHTLVLSDEIYSRLHHRNGHISVSKYYPEGTIITSGLSKWCGAGGWRLGTMIIPDELERIRQAIINVSSETFLVYHLQFNMHLSWHIKIKNIWMIIFFIVIEF